MHIGNNVHIFWLWLLLSKIYYSNDTPKMIHLCFVNNCSSLLLWPFCFILFPQNSHVFIGDQCSFEYIVIVYKGFCLLSQPLFSRITFGVKSLCTSMTTILTLLYAQNLPVDAILAIKSRGIIVYLCICQSLAGCQETHTNCFRMSSFHLQYNIMQGSPLPLYHCSVFSSEKHLVERRITRILSVSKRLSCRLFRRGRRHLELQNFRYEGKHCFALATLLGKAYV